MLFFCDCRSLANWRSKMKEFLEAQNRPEEESGELLGSDEFLYAARFISH